MPARIFLRRLLAACAVSLLFGPLLPAKPVLPERVFEGPRRPAARADAVEDEVPLAEPQFDTTRLPLPDNVPSVGFHITATSELGDLVRLEGAAHYVDSVTVTLSAWAIHSDYPGSSPLGFTHPITLKLYEVDRSGGRPRPSRVLAAITTPFLIPWRPEPDPGAPASPLRPWRGTDSQYYGGLAFNVTFELGASTTALPDEVIFGVSFNTERHGEKPVGVEGPYNSLSVGVSTTPPAVGTDLAPDALFWKTADGTRYSDGGAGGVNVLRLDDGWAAHTPAVRFNSSAYGMLASVATRLMDLRSERPEVARSLADARDLAVTALDRTLWADNRHPRATWGLLVFDLLAETADELSLIADSRDALAPIARQSADTLVRVAQSLAESAMGDALIAGAAAGLTRAQTSLDAALQARATQQHATAIDQLGETWREATLSVR